MKKIVHEIHRRSLWQVLGIYLAASWVALQVVAQMAESVGLPEWVEPFAVVLLVIGLPIVLATAFVQEGAAPASAGTKDAATKPAPAGPGASSGMNAEPVTVRPHASPAADGTVRRLFSWRNAFVGGALAFVLLAVVTWGFMTLRDRGVGPVGSLVAKGVLEEKAPLVLAEFESREPGLAATATEALRIDLSQSNVVKVVEPAVISRVLERMQIELDGPLDEALAREIAIREGWPAVIAGEINEAGGRYVLSARLLDAQDGSELLALRETADDESEIVPAVDELSSRFRERVGESYGSLRASAPLEQVTTGSLDALRLYSQALEADDTGDDQRAIALLEEAVRQDTAFAMAWRKLGVLLSNRNVEGARAVEAERRAYAHRDRLTTRERYLTEGTYFMDVERDVGRAIAAYENLLALNPEDAWALNNLGVLLSAQGEQARALELYERSHASDPTNVIALGNQSGQLKLLGRSDDARAVLEEALRQTPGSPDMLNRLASLETGLGNYAEAAALYDSLETLAAGDGYWEWVAQEGRVQIDAIRGRISTAEARRRRAADFLVERGWGGTYLWRTEWAGWTRLLAARDPAGAARLLDDALARFPIETVPDGEAPVLGIASLSAALGRTGPAQDLLARDRTADVSFYGQGWDVALRATAEARLLAESGDLEGAIERLNPLEKSVCPECGLFWTGFFLEQAGDRAGAIAAWEAYLSRGWGVRNILDAFGLGTIYESLGRMYDEEGDPEQAAGWYAKFVDLWEDADPALQPRVEAARTRMTGIYEERG